MLQLRTVGAAIAGVRQVPLQSTDRRNAAKASRDFDCRRATFCDVRFEVLGRQNSRWGISKIDTKRKSIGGIDTGEEIRQTHLQPVFTR
jgi:hypothetical protein